MVPFFIHGEIKQKSATSLEKPNNGRMFLCASRFQRTASLQNLCERRERWTIREPKRLWHLHQGNLAYRFYLVVIFTPFAYLKDFNGNRFRLVNSSPGFRDNTSLLWYRTISHNTREDVRCWDDPVVTANPAKIGQGPTLQPNIQSLIGIQDLEVRTIKSETTL
jgi:hypothetical protein